MTDEQRHSYRDDDERMENAEWDAALTRRLINSNNEEEFLNSYEEKEDGCDYKDILSKHRSIFRTASLPMLIGQSYSTSGLVTDLVIDLCDSDSVIDLCNSD